jgi:RNA polymerase sigma-70 factor (ECF subfamily)
MNEDLEQLSDPDLMKRAAAGRQEAFEIIVRRHQRPLLNFFRRMGASRDEAEDMVQETFLRLFDYRFRYRPLAKFTTFLYRLASHVRTDGLRKLQRQPRIGQLSEQSSSVEGNTAAGVGAKLDIQAALDGLSEKLRPVVVMAYFQGLRYREIAKALGIPQGTVKSRMFLALQELKKSLGAGVTEENDEG